MFLTTSQPAPSQPAPSQPAPSQPAPSQPAPSQFQDKSLIHLLFNISVSLSTLQI